MYPFASSLWLVLVCFLGGALVHVQPTSAKDYWEAGVKKHNEYRALHPVPPLELDSELAEKADKCAEYYAGLGKIDHTCPHKDGSGENLMQCSVQSYKTGKDVVEAATKLWYEEIKDYDFNKNFAKDGKDFRDIGHFTQLVWKNSKKLGMGYAVGDQKCFGVALYSPPGNYRKDYKDNVFPPTNGNGGASNIRKTGPKISGVITLALGLSVIYNSVEWISGS